MYLDSGLFAKYFKKKTEIDTYKEKISNIITEITKVPITPSMVGIKKDLIILSLKPIEKNEVFLYKEVIVDRCKQEKLPFSNIF